MKWLAALLTLLVLGALYLHLDVAALLRHVAGLRLPVFFLALGFFVPQLATTAWRWQLMVRHVCPMALTEATRLILAGKAFNAFVPSKLGEMSKAYWLTRHGRLPLAQGGALVLLEKLLDVAGLCLLLLIGVAIAPQRGTTEATAALLAAGALGVTATLLACRTAGLQGWLRARGALGQRVAALLAAWEATVQGWKQAPGRLAGIVALSGGLWVLHLAQITLFFFALGSHVPLPAVLAYVPMSLFIGLLPLTIGGMGTRDAALILLFSRYESAAVMAAVGLLCSLRYWVDTLLGVPFLSHYAWQRRP
ncbi:MAG: hypothetical protein KatS3mg131_3187 [Candidatus Tectimicrobiota bacterium]|nr:MAG: hypothetical protein KatS3mg131_3187 [Candidatus Tectomicrobia bacterium]